MSWKDLTKAERKHIWPIRTIQGVRDMRKAQKELDPNKEVCWECRKIAEKLGIE